MNQDQVTQIRQILDQIDQFKVGQVLAESYPSQDLKTVMFDELSAAEISELTQRVTCQFRTELDQHNARLLPTSFYWETAQISNANRKIVEVFSQFLGYLQGRNWAACGQSLDLLIGYQMICGFWDRGSKTRYSANRARQQTLFSDLELQLEVMKQATKQADGRSSELTAIIQQRESESQQMAAHLAEGTRQQQQIATILNQCTTSDGSIQQILSSQQTNLTESKSLLTQLNERTQTLEGQIKDAAEKLLSSETRLKHMQDKEAWVNKLAGTAAAGELGGKFEGRATSLKHSAWGWLVGVLLVLVASSFWTLKAHDWLWSNVTVNASNVWFVLAANFGVLTPVLLGIGFVITQYGKERHFQEEYSFRAAVAMTLSSFADRLSESSPAERDKLIKETIDKLYALPHSLQPKAKDALLNDGKLKDNIGAVTDLIKAAKKGE